MIVLLTRADVKFFFSGMSKKVLPPKSPTPVGGDGPGGLLPRQARLPLPAGKRRLGGTGPGRLARFQRGPLLPFARGILDRFHQGGPQIGLLLDTLGQVGRDVRALEEQQGEAGVAAALAVSPGPAPAGGP